MRRFLEFVTVLLSVFALLACSNGLSSKQANNSNEVAISAAIKSVVKAQNTLELDMLDELLSPDFQRIAADVNTNDREAFKAFLTQSRSMFREYDMQIEDIATNANGGFVRWRFLGVYTGPGSELGGSNIDVTGLAHYKYSDGKLTHEFIGFNPEWFQAQISHESKSLLKP